MPEARRVSHPFASVATTALAFALFVGLQAPAAGQAAASGQSAAAKPAPPAPGAGVFPLSTVWMVTLDGPPALPPAYDETRAYVVLRPDPDRPSSPARLAAISLGDGSIRWTRDIPAADSLAASAGMVFTCAGRLLQAYAAADGTSRWQLPLDAPLAAPPHFHGDRLVAATQASNALAVSLRDGSILWQVRLPSPATGEAAVTGDAVYLPLTDDRVLRLQLETGAVAWDRKILSQPTTLLALDDRIFVGTGEYWFYALRPDDGRVLWRVRVGGDIIGAPAADRSGVYFLALDNLLRALDRAGGSLRWRQMLVRRARFGPLRTEDVLFVSGASPTIQGYDTVAGKSLGSFDAPHDLAGPAHLIPGLLARDFLVVALTGEGELMALRTQSLEPEAFALSPMVYLMAGFPVWRW